MLILKEFDYKNKRYAVLTELDTCDEDCDCGCNEGEECDCNCKCGENCKCDDDCGCKNGGECTCEDCACGCNCNDESVFILEITKDKEGKEVFKSIDDEKLFDEVIDKADELLNE